MCSNSTITRLVSISIISYVPLLLNTEVVLFKTRGANFLFGFKKHKGSQFVDFFIFILFNYSNTRGSILKIRFYMTEYKYF